MSEIIYNTYASTIRIQDDHEITRQRIINKTNIKAGKFTTV